jgi:succinate-acetate transporter protein
MYSSRIGALRRNIGFVALLFFLCITFLLLAIGAWSAQVNITKAGGGFGILTASIAYYCGLSELLVKGESWFGLPLGTIKQGRVD